MTKPIETPSPSLPSLPSPRLLLHVATTRLASMVSIRSGSIHIPIAHPKSFPPPKTVFEVLKIALDLASFSKLMRRPGN